MRRSYRFPGAPEADEEEPAHAFLLQHFGQQHEAIVKIQRAFREWRKMCLAVGWISAENPWHWVHWRAFRAQYGWTREELYNEYGELRQRTDGGTRRMMTDATLSLKDHPLYRNAIEYYQEQYDKLPLDGDSALISTLQESGGLDMSLIARVLATRWWRMKDRQGKGVLQPTQAATVNTALGSVMLLHSAVVRDLKTSLNFAQAGGQRTHILDMLGRFTNKVNSTKKMLKATSQDTTMTDVVKDYIQQLEDSLRWCYPPPDPPADLPPEVLDLCTASRDALYNENQPRVCRLRKFGRRWLKAVQESSRTKAPLLRTRSAGTLGLAGPPHIDCSQATLLPTLRPDGTMHEHLQKLVQYQRQQKQQGLLQARPLHCKNTAFLDNLDWRQVAASAGAAQPGDPGGVGGPLQQLPELDNADLADMLDDMMDPQEEGAGGGALAADEEDLDGEDDEEDNEQEDGADATLAPTPSRAAGAGRGRGKGGVAGGWRGAGAAGGAKAPPPQQSGVVRQDKMRNRRFPVHMYTSEVRALLVEMGLVTGPRTSCETVLKNLRKYLRKPLVVPALSSSSSSSSSKPGDWPPRAAGGGAVFVPARPAAPTVLLPRSHSVTLMSELGSRIMDTVTREYLYGVVVLGGEEGDEGEGALHSPFRQQPHQQQQQEGAAVVAQAPAQRERPGLDWAELQRGWRAAGLQRHHAHDGALLLLELEIGWHPDMILATDRLIAGDDAGATLPLSPGALGGPSLAAPRLPGPSAPPSKALPTGGPKEARPGPRTLGAKSRLQPTLSSSASGAAPGPGALLPEPPSHAGAGGGGGGRAPGELGEAGGGGTASSSEQQDPLAGAFSGAAGATDLVNLRRGRWLAVVMADALLAQMPKPKRVQAKGPPIRVRRMAQMLAYIREYSKRQYGTFNARAMASFALRGGITIGQAKMEKRNHAAKHNWINLYCSSIFQWFNKYLTLGVLPDDEAFDAALEGIHASAGADAALVTSPSTLGAKPSGPAPTPPAGGAGRQPLPGGPAQGGSSGSSVAPKPSLHHALLEAAPHGDVGLAHSASSPRGGRAPTLPGVQEAAGSLAQLQQRMLAGLPSAAGSTAAAHPEASILQGPFSSCALPARAALGTRDAFPVSAPAVSHTLLPTGSNSSGSAAGPHPPGRPGGGPPGLLLLPSTASLGSVQDIVSLQLPTTPSGRLMPVTTLAAQLAGPASASGSLGRQASSSSAINHSSRYALGGAARFSGAAGVGGTLSQTGSNDHHPQHAGGLLPVGAGAGFTLVSRTASGALTSDWGLTGGTHPAAGEGSTSRFSTFMHQQQQLQQQLSASASASNLVGPTSDAVERLMRLGAAGGSSPGLARRTSTTGGLSGPLASLGAGAATALGGANRRASVVLSASVSGPLNRLTSALNVSGSSSLPGSLAPQAPALTPQQTGRGSVFASVQLAPSAALAGSPLVSSSSRGRRASGVLGEGSFAGHGVLSGGQPILFASDAPSTMDTRASFGKMQVVLPTSGSGNLGPRRASVAGMLPSLSKA